MTWEEGDSWNLLGSKPEQERRGEERGGSWETGKDTCWALLPALLCERGVIAYLSWPTGTVRNTSKAHQRGLLRPFRGRSRTVPRIHSPRNSALPPTWHREERLTSRLSCSWAWPCDCMGTSREVRSKGTHHVASLGGLFRREGHELLVSAKRSPRGCDTRARCEDPGWKPRSEGH